LSMQRERSGAPPGMPFRRRNAVVLLLLLLACSPGERTARQAIEPFLDAVQHEDIEALYCRMAGAAGSVDLGSDSASRRKGFEAWARARFEAYEEGRDAGEVDLEGHGIVEVKLFALGKGTWYDVTRIQQAGEGALLVRTELLFGYGEIDLSRFSPGTTFYLCGSPPGRVRQLRRPAGGGEETVEVLDRLTLEWTLVRSPAADGCPEVWSVASVVPVDGTWSTKTITWEF